MGTNPKPDPLQAGNRNNSAKRGLQTATCEPNTSSEDKQLMLHKHRGMKDPVNAGCVVACCVLGCGHGFFLAPSQRVCGQCVKALGCYHPKPKRNCGQLSRAAVSPQDNYCIPLAKKRNMQ